jgi:hypothetical protein
MKTYSSIHSISRSQNILWVTALVLSVLIFFWRWWLYTPKLWEDAVLYGWPSASILAEHLAHFKLALWDPYSYGGMTWLGPPIYGNFYFGQIWLVVAVWITGEPLGQLSYATYLAAHYVVAVIGMWLLSRKLRFEPPIAFMGAIGYALSFIIVFRFRHGCYLIPLSWMPLLCWLAVRFLEEPSWRRISVLGLFSGAVFLGGAPQYNFFITLVLLVLILLLPNQNTISRKELYLKASVGFLIAMGINSICLFYQFEYALFCKRIDAPFSFYAQQPSAWWRIGSLFFPYLTGCLYPPSYYKLEWGDDRPFPFMFTCEETIFPGLIILLGACLYCVLSIWKNRATWPWLALLVIGAVLSLGEFNPIQALVRFIVYPLATARHPIRMWCIAHLGLLVLSMYGYKHFFSLNPAKPTILKAALLLLSLYFVSILITAWRFYVIPPANATLTKSQYFLLISIAIQLAFILGIICSLCWFLYQRKITTMQIVLPVALYAELLILVSPMIQGPADDSIMYHFGQNDNAFFTIIRNGRRRMDGQKFFETNQRAARARIPTLQGYSTMKLPFTGNDFVSEKSLLKAQRDRRLDLYGVAAIVSRRGDYMVAAFRGAPFPKTWFCEEAEFMASTEMIHRIDAPDLDLRQTVLLEPKSKSLVESSPNTGLINVVQIRNDGQKIVNVVSYKDNEVQLRVKSLVPGWVVINDHYAPGWNCTVNGREVDILRANCIFRAVPVPAGEHVIRYWFWPQALTVGLIIGGIAVTTAAILIIKRTPFS